MSGFRRLLSPVAIGRMRLRNRIVMAPMETLYATPEGLPSERTIAYFEARAQGGAALLTLGASTIDGRHPEVPNSLRFHDDAVLDAHRALCDAVHAHGACIQPQLVHPGPDGLGPELHGVEALGPSAIQGYLTKTTSREMSVAELDAVVDAYRAAAVRVRAAGYDGIELHAAHGYMLLGSFLTPWRNARRDAYGARDPEGRVRAVAEVVEAIKSEVGADFPLTLRISGHERVAGGRMSFDTASLAPRLVDAGVDAFHVSGGVIDRFVTQMVNGSDAPAGLNVAAAAAVKRSVEVPVIVVGRIHEPELAERILAEDSADLVAMGRPLLADPDLPAKLASGQARRVRRCISCENCIDAMEQRAAMDCAVAPRTGRERELAAGPAAVSRQVLVVGGGPAGLEAARVAAARGHRVSLHEASGRLGGAWLAASIVHPENRPLLDWLVREVEAAGVEVRLRSALDADDVLARAPDAVVVATGGRLRTPALPGADGANVITGRALRDLLAGRRDSAVPLRSPLARAARAVMGRAPAALGPEAIDALSRLWLPVGRRVAIVGADLVALELAEWLAGRGRRVSVLEPGSEVAPEVGGKRRSEHLDRLDRQGVPLNVGVDIDRVGRDGVLLRLPTGAVKLVEADTVVLAGAVEPAMELHDALAGRVPALFAAGDCTGLSLAQKALLDGARAACAIE